MVDREATLASQAGRDGHQQQQRSAMTEEDVHAAQPSTYSLSDLAACLFPCCSPRRGKRSQAWGDTQDGSEQGSGVTGRREADERTPLLSKGPISPSAEASTAIASTDQNAAAGEALDRETREKSSDQSVFGPPPSARSQDKERLLNIVGTLSGTFLPVHPGSTARHLLLSATSPYPRPASSIVPHSSASSVVGGGATTATHTHHPRPPSLTAAAAAAAAATQSSRSFSSSSRSNSMDQLQWASIVAPSGAAAAAAMASVSGSSQVAEGDEGAPNALPTSKKPLAFVRSIRLSVIDGQKSTAGQAKRNSSGDLDFVAPTGTHGGVEGSTNVLGGKRRRRTSTSSVSASGAEAAAEDASDSAPGESSDAGSIPASTADSGSAGLQSMEQSTVFASDDKRTSKLVHLWADEAGPGQSNASDTSLAATTRGVEKKGSSTSSRKSSTASGNLAITVSASRSSSREAGAARSTSTAKGVSAGAAGGGGSTATSVDTPTTGTAPSSATLTAAFTATPTTAQPAPERRSLTPSATSPIVGASTEPALASGLVSPAASAGAVADDETSPSASALALQHTLGLGMTAATSSKKPTSAHGSPGSKRGERPSQEKLQRLQEQQQQRQELGISNDTEPGLAQAGPGDWHMHLEQRLHAVTLEQGPLMETWDDEGSDDKGEPAPVLGQGKMTSSPLGPVD